MGMKKIEVWQYECERCKHKWFPRDLEAKEPVEPNVCPKCKSPYWSKPRKEKSAETAKT